MKPRLLKIIWTDFPALAFAILIPMCWIMGVAFSLLEPDPHYSMTWLLLRVALPVTILTIPFLLWRIVRIRKLFASGRIVPGVVTYVRLFKDRGRVNFSYVMDGRELNSWTPIHQNRCTKALFPGQQVEVVVDPQCTDRAVIRHLYL
jgi:hypothetical protein